MISLVAVLTINAQDAQYQDIHYTVDEDHLTAEVGLNPRAAGELFIPETIVVGQNTYTVIAVGDKAFKGCKNLTAIVLPKTIDRVYRSAFDGTGIMLNKANWAEGCLWIDSILIATDKSIKPRFAVPEGTRLIAAGAFQGNKTVVRVELPSCISRIDHETFRDCKNLQKVVIPASVTSIGDSAFEGCTLFTSFDIPDGVTEIGAGTFKDCTLLAAVDYPPTVTSIGDNAFENCALLAEIPDLSKVKSMGGHAFAGTAWLDAQPDGMVIKDDVRVIEH